jgi:DNA polymerase-3 subunit delta
VKFPAARLPGDLRSNLRSVYLVSGDEPLLVQEACAAIVERAKQAGFDEIERHTVERGFDWTGLTAGADNLSLFSQRRIVDLRLPSCKPGEAGARALKSLATKDDPDQLLLVSCPKLDPAASRSVWVKTLDQQGAVVQVWPLDVKDLKSWVQRRMASAGLKVDAAGAELLADRVEGNLLAAAQEIEKLKLLHAGGELSEADVERAVADSARFDVFRLADAALAGQANRCMRMLWSLHREGVEPVLVLWALARDIGLLEQVHFSVGLGESQRASLDRLRIWQRRQPLVQRALGRLNPSQVRNLVAQAAVVDKVIKGRATGQPWDALAGLLLVLLGRSAGRGVAMS